MGTPRYACLKCDRLLPVGAEKCPFCGARANFSAEANSRGAALAAKEVFGDDTADIPYVKSKKKGTGLLGALIAAAAASGNSGNHKKKKHKGRCNGDCANCPPHYGYRYGRWYYGHGHMHGCQFGGNRRGGGD